MYSNAGHFVTLSNNSFIIENIHHHSLSLSVCMAHLEVQHYSFADPPQGEEPHVKVQRHLEVETRQKPLVCKTKQHQKQHRLLKRRYLNRSSTQTFISMVNYVILGADNASTVHS